MRVLDLYCGAGGAAVGYYNAGHDDIVGVDIELQFDYPFEFVRDDALHFLLANWQDFDFIHTSPPCQASCAPTKGSNKALGKEYPQLIPATRAALHTIPLPSVIENVQGSQVRKDLVLCGEMFGLRVIRHRYFEFHNMQPPVIAHKPHHPDGVQGYTRSNQPGGSYYRKGHYLQVYGDGGGKGTVQEWQEAMQIYWTNDRRSIAEAIPPAYTQFIGQHLSDPNRRSIMSVPVVETPKEPKYTAKQVAAWEAEAKAATANFNVITPAGAVPAVEITDADKAFVKKAYDACQVAAGVWLTIDVPLGIPVPIAAELLSNRWDVIAAAALATGYQARQNKQASSTHNRKFRVNLYAPRGKAAATPAASVPDPAVQ